MRIMKHVPNALSVTRIILALSLLIIPALTPLFLIIYTIAGITDMIDGPIARKFNVTSSLGANLDGTADYTFVAVGIVRIVPELLRNGGLSPVLVAIIVIMLVIMKGAGMAVGYIRYKQLMMMHTYGAKTGAMLAFLFTPFLFITGIDVNFLASLLGIYVFLFLAEEIVINLVMPEPNRDVVGLYQALQIRREMTAQK